MKRDHSPETLAQEWLTAMDASLGPAVKPGVMVVMLPALALLIRRIRRQDARAVRLRGLWRQAHGEVGADALAQDFAQAILAQNKVPK